MDIKNHKQYVEQPEDGQENALLETHSTLVRIRRGPDTSIFRGWGPKI